MKQWPLFILKHFSVHSLDSCHMFTFLECKYKYKPIYSHCVSKNVHPRKTSHFQSWNETLWGQPTGWRVSEAADQTSNGVILSWTRWGVSLLWTTFLKNNLSWTGRRCEQDWPTVDTQKIYWTENMSGAGCRLWSIVEDSWCGAPLTDIVKMLSLYHKPLWCKL